MKKSLKILFLSLFALIVVSGCSLTKLNREKFKTIVEAEKYEIVNIESMQVANIKSQDVARNKDNDIEIQFYTFINEKSAKNFFDEKKTNMKLEEQYVSSDSNAINWINYSSYITRTNNNYKRVIRKYNTILLIESSAVNTSKAEAIIKKLGY